MWYAGCLALTKFNLTCLCYWCRATIALNLALRPTDVVTIHGFTGARPVEASCPSLVILNQVILPNADWAMFSLTNILINRRGHVVSKVMLPGTQCNSTHNLEFLPVDFYSKQHRSFLRTRHAHCHSICCTIRPHRFEIVVQL